VTQERQKLSILKTRHDSVSAGHPGQHKTFELVSRDFYWPGMRKYIKNYVQSCTTCQRNKASRHKPYGLLEPLPIADSPWSSISMDFIVKLPPTQGFDSIMVVVCRRTKQAHFIPCKETLDAKGTAELFIQHIFRLHGLPHFIISDRGPQFRSQFWTALTSALGIKPQLSSAYHPQTDGQTERTNQSLEHYLRCFVNYQQDDWPSLLPFAEFAHNNSSHSSTLLSPFFANYGYNPRFDFLSHQDDDSPHVPAAVTHLDKLKDISTFLDSTLKRAQEDAARYANKHRLDHGFAVGQQVWLLRKNLQTKRLNAKLDHLKLGPFRITEQINPVTFKLNLPASMHIHPVFHVSLLETCVANTIPGRILPPLPPVVIEGEEEYEVEDILDAKWFGKSLKFLVKWKGYTESENTWEPEAHLEHCPDILQHFKTLYPTKLQKSPKRGR
jgi:transposase InsO family protein